MREAKASPCRTKRYKLVHPRRRAEQGRIHNALPVNLATHMALLEAVAWGEGGADRWCLACPCGSRSSPNEICQHDTRMTDGPGNQRRRNRMPGALSRFARRDSGWIGYAVSSAAWGGQGRSHHFVCSLPVMSCSGRCLATSLPSLTE